MKHLNLIKPCYILFYAMYFSENKGIFRFYNFLNSIFHIILCVNIGSLVSECNYTNVRGREIVSFF